MSDHRGYQIDFPTDDVEAPGTKTIRRSPRLSYPLTPEVTVISPPRSTAPHSSSSPTLSSSTGSEFSGSLSVGTSKSVPSIPSVESQPSRYSLRPRSKASKTKSSTTVDRTTVSEPSNPKTEEDSDSTYSEQSPLVGSIDIPPSDEDPRPVPGFASFGKIMLIGAGAFLGLGVALVVVSLLDYEPEIPDGFVSNTTMVFDSDVDMA